MALTDAQIDRFSRQIILPQIGGRGQERLLQSSVALAGSGDLAAITALYLAGAGIGHIALHGSASDLSTTLSDLAPDLQMPHAPGLLGNVAADVLVACNAALPEIDDAARSGRSVVAGGTEAHGGWLVVADGREACASCAARFGVREPLDLLGAPALQSAAAGVIGSLMALAVLKILLGMGEAARPARLEFDAARATLTEHPIERAPDCPACSA